jgi:hypothetical protein
MKGKTLALITIYTIATTLFASPMAAQAAVMAFGGPLTGANESPPTGSPGTGQAIVVLDTTAHTLNVNITFSGLLSGTTASHIHCCLPSPFATGVNEPVGTTIPTFPGFPLGVTSGTYNQTFDLTANSTYNLAGMPPGNAGNPFLGNSALTAEPVFVAALQNGETYLNIHTAAPLGFPTGEIRGFLAPIPLPAALPLFATGLAGLGLLGWRRKGKAVAA